MLSEHWYLYHIEGMPDEMVGPYTFPWKKIPPEYVEVAILPVTELDRLRGIEARLRSMGEVEEYAVLAHQAYCQSYLAHKGELYWTEGDYFKLDETYKGYDRLMAKAVIDAYRRAVLGEVEYGQ